MSLAPLPLPGGGSLYPGHPPSCILVHGFTATPEEMRFLAERISSRGRQVVSVMLAGHGTTVEDLSRCRWTDWWGSVREVLFAFASPACPAVIVGQSLGGLLALWAATRHPERVAALALLAPALHLQARWLYWVRRVLPLLARWRPTWPKGAADIADAEAKRRRQGYDAIPLRALAELLKLQGEVRRTLSQVRQPTLVVQSVSDHTCSWHSVALLQAALGERLQLLKLEKSFHVLSVDVDRETVAQRLCDFLDECVPSLGRDSRAEPSCPGLQDERS